MDRECPSTSMTVLSSSPLAARAYSRRRAPGTSYAKSGDVSIAYQVVGDGPDLVLVPGFVSNVEAAWAVAEPGAGSCTGSRPCRG